MAEPMLLEDWYLHLPAGYNTLAKKNLDAYAENPESVTTLKVRNLADALNYGFCWARTPEGDNFWSTIHRKAEDGDHLDVNTLPKIPT